MESGDRRSIQYESTHARTASINGVLPFASLESTAQIFSPREIVPVDLADEHGREAFRGQLPGSNEKFDHAIVAGLRRVINDFTVIRIRPAFEQQPG